MRDLFKPAFLIGLVVAVLPLVVKAEVSKLETSKVVKETVLDYQMLDGEIEAVNKSTVSAQTAGVISKVSHDVGDYVKKGSLLARISSENQKSGLQQAKAAVNESKAAISKASAAVVQAEAAAKEAMANYTVARSEYNRVKGLYAKRILTRSQYDQAEGKMRSSLARLESARASLKVAKAGLAAAKSSLAAAKAGLNKAGQQLGYTEVFAPYSGIVVERHVELGEVVAPGSPIMTGISLSELRAVTNIPQRLILKVRKYKSARIFVEDDKVGIPVKKLTFFPYADPKTNAFKVRALLGSAIKGLFPGVFVKMGFVIGKQKHLLIPASAVAYRSEVTGVYVVDENNVPMLRQVRLGNPTSDGKIRVLAGLDEGERIALDPVHAAVNLKLLREEKFKKLANKHETASHE